MKAQNGCYLDSRMAFSTRRQVW